VGGKHPAAGRAVLRLLHDPPARRRGRVHLPLGEPQQRQAGLRLPAPPAGLAVGLLGLGELAAQPVELALPVEGAARRRVAGRLGEPLAGPPRLVHGVRPGAVELHDLGAVHLALPAVGDQVRLGRDPVAQRGGPLLRPAQVEDLLAQLDGGAVGLAGDHRRQLAGGGGDHDLVEQGHARGGLAQHEQGLAPPEPGERRQVGLAEAVADLGRPGEHRARGRGVTLHHALVCDQHQEIPLFDADPLAVVQQPACPSAGACQLPAQEQAEASHRADRAARSGSFRRSSSR
jgi:hypothetical protein